MPSGVYARSNLGESLYQGEILSNVVITRLTESAVLTGEPEIEIEAHPLAIVLTQDCDLLQDYDLRKELEDLRRALAEAGDAEKDALRQKIAKKTANLLPCVLLCQMTVLEHVKNLNQGSDLWKPIRANANERFHVMCEVLRCEDNLNTGLPPLAVDFRKYFSIPTSELYNCISERVPQKRLSRRRCKLLPPYREHLVTRFCNYLGRVSLDPPHQEMWGNGDETTSERGAARKNLISWEEVSKRFELEG